jgi:hypothetical protein
LKDESDEEVYGGEKVLREEAQELIGADEEEEVRVGGKR